MGEAGRDRSLRSLETGAVAGLLDVVEAAGPAAGPLAGEVDWLSVPNLRARAAARSSSTVRLVGGAIEPDVGAFAAGEATV